MSRLPALALCLLPLACRASPADELPAPIEAPTPAQQGGLELVVLGAPAGLSVEVLASDERPALVRERALDEGARLDLDEGFVRVVLRAGEDRREIQLYLRPGATLRYDWAEGAASIEGATLLDRRAAEEAWTRDLEALMRAMANAEDEGELPEEVRALLERQRRTIDAGGDGPKTDLLRLRHAAFAAQLTGAEDAWTVVAAVAPDSPAWAAYAPWIVELAWFLRELPEARAHLQAVREHSPDRGLQSAFTALDLLAAERSDEADALADAYLAATRIDGPITVGEAMPAFELRSIDGRREISSAGLRGTPYLVEIWSTWCEPCVESMAELHALHEELAEAEPGLRIVSVAVDDTRAPVESFRRDRWPMPWANAWVPGGDALWSAWGVEGVPYAVLVDAEGRVRAANPHLDLDVVRELARAR